MQYPDFAVSIGLIGGSYNWVDVMKIETKKFICYSATHAPSGKKYIGMTGKSLEERRSEHFEEANVIYDAMKSGDLRRNEFSEKALKRIKFKVFNAHLVLFTLIHKQEFEWAVEGEGTEQEMMELERKLIDKLDATSIYAGFNMLPMDDRLARSEFEKNYSSYRKNIVDFLAPENNLEARGKQLFARVIELSINGFR